MCVCVWGGGVGGGGGWGGGGGGGWGGGVGGGGGGGGGVGGDLTGVLWFSKEILVENILLAKENCLIMSPFLHVLVEFQPKYTL